MCEIFFLRAPQGETVTDESLRKLFNTALNGATRNNDGFGVFNEDREIIKDARKYSEGDVATLMEVFSGSEFVVMHERMATQGSNKPENTHPLVFDREDRAGSDILVHNGVVTVTSQLVENISDRVDSAEMLEAIIRAEGDTTPERIKDGLGNDVSGRVSVFYYDAEGELYYFRKGSSFSFVRNNDTGELFGATRERRLKDMYETTSDTLFGKSSPNLSDYVEPEEGKIYHMTNGDGETPIVGEFDMRRRSYNVRSSVTTSTKKKDEPEDNDVGTEDFPDSYAEYRDSLLDEDGNYAGQWDPDKYRYDKHVTEQYTDEELAAMYYESSY